MNVVSRGRPNITTIIILGFYDFFYVLINLIQSRYDSSAKSFSILLRIYKGTFNIKTVFKNCKLTFTNTRTLIVSKSGVFTINLSRSTGALISSTLSYNILL